MVGGIQSLWQLTTQYLILNSVSQSLQQTTSQIFDLEWWHWPNISGKTWSWIVIFNHCDSHRASTWSWIMCLKHYDWELIKFFILNGYTCFHLMCQRTHQIFDLDIVFSELDAVITSKSIHSQTPWHVQQKHGLTRSYYDTELCNTCTLWPRTLGTKVTFNLYLEISSTQLEMSNYMNLLSLINFIYLWFFNFWFFNCNSLRDMSSGSLYQRSHIYTYL